MTKEKAAAAAAEDKIPTSKNFTEELQALNEALASKKEEVDSLCAKVEALEAENVGLKEVIEELNAAIESKDSEIAKSSKRAIIKVGKESYELRFPKFTFRHKGKAIEVTEKILKADKELCEALVKVQDGPLIKKGGK